MSLGTSAIRWRHRIGLLALGLYACGGALTVIEVEQEASSVIEGGTIVEQLAVDLGLEGLTEIDFTASEELQNQGVSPGDIRDVRLTEFVLEVVAPSDGDLSFATSIELFIASPDLPMRRIAYQDEFPQGQRRVELNVEDIDLTDYAVAPSMTISSRISGNRPARDTEVRAVARFDVGVTLQGACAALESSD